MRLTLVQPPSGVFDREDLAPPVGLLSLAASVEQDDVRVAVLDMNLRGMREPEFLDGFYDNATRWIADSSPDVVGFTSMALESHVCLELARRIKLEDPGVVTVLGGPHFSAIALEALELYPWVDFVIAGEGEPALRALLQRLRGRGDASPLVNVALRTRSGPSLERVLKSLPDFGALPFPAYHLVDLGAYFETNPVRLLDYEPGRGCIFRCSFCYSPGLWGQGEQIKQAEQIAGEVARLTAMGARHLFFVQDNLLNTKGWAISLCDEIARLPAAPTWNCYATLPQLVPEVVDALGRAGCTDVYIGVDAVSAVSRKSFLKHFFKGWAPLKDKLTMCLERGVGPTCAFMVDVPQGDARDTNAALETALFARNLGCGVRLNTLTLYNGTGSAAELGGAPRTYTPLKPALLLDTPEVLQDNPYARRHPGLFPFHHTFLPLPLYERFVTGMHAAYTLFRSFPRTLLQHVVSDGASLWGVLDALAARVGDLTRLRPLDRRPAEREVFLADFPRRSLSRVTRAAFELESAELTLRAGGPAQRASVSIADRRREYRVGRYELVRLPAPPERLADAALKLDGSTALEPYVLLNQGGRTQCKAVDGAVAHALDGLAAARRGGASVDIEVGLFEELVRLGVVSSGGAGPATGAERR